MSAPRTTQRRRSKPVPLVAEAAVGVSQEHESEDSDGGIIAALLELNQSSTYSPPYLTSSSSPPLQQPSASSTILDHSCIDLSDDEDTIHSVDDDEDDDCHFVAEVKKKPRLNQAPESPLQIVGEFAPFIVRDVEAAPPPVVPPTPTPSNAKTLKCSVCLDDFQTILSDPDRKLFSTKCGHIFCENCLKEAVRSSKQCPQCRTKLTIKQMHQVFL